MKTYWLEVHRPPFKPKYEWRLVSRGRRPMMDWLTPNTVAVFRVRGLNLNDAIARCLVGRGQKVMG